MVTVRFPSRMTKLASSSRDTAYLGWDYIYAKTFDHLGVRLGHEGREGAMHFLVQEKVIVMVEILDYDELVLVFAVIVSRARR